MSKKIIPNHRVNTMRKNIVSIIIPCKNEAGTIGAIVQKMPRMGTCVEIVFIDGHSTDGTRETIDRITRKKHPMWMKICSYTQPGSGKWDAVIYGIYRAAGDILMIYDADMSVPIADLTKFYAAAIARPDALIIGSRFVYPQERDAMRLLNHTGNVAFSWIFSRMLRTRITDTLCGTKVFSKRIYYMIELATKSFRTRDPYGDFTFLLGAGKLHMPIIEVPISYKARVYGTTKISRFRDGFRLLIVLWYAMRDFRTNVQAKRQ